MKRYELKIDILDVNYVDLLIRALARQGFAPYYHAEDGVICFEVDEHDLTQITANDAGVIKEA